ncbi:MAG: hypothetical protein HYT42_01935 [Candidatus Sungbacteria bacterium]|nr:hypothetical protein [Candidatus Sungbacteria bacterium]
MTGSEDKTRKTKAPPSACRGRASLGFGTFDDGFTLLEVVISFGIFFSVVVTSVGAVLAISNAQVKSSNIQIIQDDLRFSMEFTTREIRSGTNFTTSSGTGCPPVCTQINFTTIKPDRSTENIGYCLKNSAIYKILSGSSGCDDPNLTKAITSDLVIIDDLKFLLRQGAGIQPRVTMAVRARSANPKFPSEFMLETTVTQRFRP